MSLTANFSFNSCVDQLIERNQLLWLGLLLRWSQKRGDLADIFSDQSLPLLLWSENRAKLTGRVVGQWAGKSEHGGHSWGVTPRGATVIHFPATGELAQRAKDISAINQAPATATATGN